MKYFRFEKLNVPRLNIEQKYSSIFLQYGEEIEEIKKVNQIHVIYLGFLYKL